MAVGAPLTEAVRTGQALFFESAEVVATRYPRFAGYLQPDAAALAAVPLTVHGRTIGALGLVFAAPRRFYEEDRAAMRALGEQCAEAMDRARLYDAAARARAAAEVASRAKDDFLSTLSHELRTPLTAILGWTHLLRARRPEPPALDRGLETIERNSRALVQLIEELLDVSRIAADKICLELRWVDPAPIVRAAVDVVRPAADAKRITIETILAEAAGPVRADAARLQQVAWNLLANAVKFTPEGGRVSVHLGRRDETLALRVTDSGVGIDAKFLPHVFERYRQADASAARTQGGLGLGLSIAQRLVELHGGTITAASEGPGRGATFTVTLPVPRLEVEAWLERVTPPPWAAASRRLDGVSVLVVDDRDDVRDLVAAILQDQGARVGVASSSAEALRTFERERPDVLVSDIGLPEEDGYALLRKLRAGAAAQGRRVPAVALTAYAGPADVRAAELAGFQRHLAKPIHAPALIEAVAKLAGRE
jgi:signal transduction histidine kinase/CheY-like chemotaxis protein